MLPPLIEPENQNQQGSIDEKSFGFGFPSFAFSGSMELMAVPKKKVWSLFIEFVPSLSDAKD